MSKRDGRSPAVIDLPVSLQARTERVAILGLGPGAQAHADILKRLGGVRLEAVIDPDLERARKFAWRNGGVAAATSLAALLETQQLDAVHILAPPSGRAALAHEALSLGLAVLTESPMAAELADAQALARGAAETGRAALAVNHDLLFDTAFARLSEAATARRLGPLMSVSAIVAVPLEPAGRATPHFLAELAQPLAQILSLTGPILHWGILAGGPADKISSRAHTLCLALTGTHCDAQLHLQLGATYPVWQITALCADGVLKADLVRDRFSREERSEKPEALDAFLDARRLSRVLRREARRNLFAHGRALLGLDKEKTAVPQSLEDSIAAFHRRDIAWVNKPEGALAVQRLCHDIAAEAFPAPAVQSRAPAPAPFRPDAVVLGGTGFLGHHIVQAFAARGLKVAALSRAPVGPEDGDQVRFFQGDAGDGDALARLIEGAAILVNATTPQITADWTECEQHLQARMATLIAACRQAGLKRLVHLSALEALYLGSRDEVITGRASADPYDWQRDPYARAKGLEEITLLTGYEESLLPVSILRPGIVVGEGGTPYPSAVGQFVNGRHCLGWNRGNNPLPFVLAQDVADAVVAASEKEGALGHCFNLVGDVRPSAREYIAVLGESLGRPFVFHGRSPEAIHLREWLTGGIRRKSRRQGFLTRRELASRTMVAMPDCADAKAALAWTPVADRETFIALGIGVHAGQSPKPGPA